MRTILAGLAVAVMSLGAIPPATAVSDVPAYGVIVISDEGSGPHAVWTYDGLLVCGFTSNGPGGVASHAIVTCSAAQSPLSFNCPMMMVSRTTLTVVGARAKCSSTLEMGVGTSGTAWANLGHVSYAITCEAYVDYGVLVAPYTVTCAEPGVPTLGASLP